MSLPLNMRFRFISPQEMKGQPTIPINVPNNPANPLQYVVIPALLEIELQDPDDNMKTVWIEVPFKYPDAPPIFQIEPATRPRGKRN